jgi:flagellar hook-length control protein FliK
MPTVADALSVSSSLAALLTAAPADPAATPTATPATTPGQPADPFAALLATVAAGQAAAVTTTPVAAPVAPLPVAPPVAADPDILAANDEAPTSDGSAAKDDDKADPLGDAIDAGVTAVLALAPTIAPPPVQPVAQPAPVKTDTPVARKIGAVTPARTQPVQPTTLAQADQPAATGPDQIAAKTPLDSDQVQPDQAPLDQQAGNDRALSDQAKSDQPKPDQAPATPILSADALHKVVAVLRNTPAAASSAPIAAAPTPIVLTDTAQADAPVAAPVTTADTTATAPAQPGAERQVAQVQAQQPRRRDTDPVAQPRRADTARKRSDSVTADAAPVGLTQRTADLVNTAAKNVADSINAKGDAVVQQTLSVARDGAWLDTLARDIANSAGNGSDLHFKLDPQNLGSLTVAISQGADGASIRMTADTDTTRNLLLDAQPKLIAEARAQGLKVSDTHVDLNQHQSQNQGQNQDASRWAQANSGQNGAAANGQNRQSSPSHQPFVSNLGRNAEADSESPARDSDELYA